MVYSLPPSSSRIHAHTRVFISKIASSFSGGYALAEKAAVPKAAAEEAAAEEAAADKAASARAKAKAAAAKEAGKKKQKNFARQVEARRG